MVSFNYLKSAKKRPMHIVQYTLSLFLGAQDACKNSFYPLRQQQMSMSVALDKRGGGGIVLIRLRDNSKSARETSFSFGHTR